MTADEHVGTLQLVVVELVPAAAALVRRGRGAGRARVPQPAAGCRRLRERAEPGRPAGRPRGDRPGRGRRRAGAQAGPAGTGLVGGPRADRPGAGGRLRRGARGGLRPRRRRGDRRAARVRGGPAEGEVLEFFDGQRLRFDARRSSARGADERGGGGLRGRGRQLPRHRPRVLAGRDPARGRRAPRGPGPPGGRASPCSRRPARCSSRSARVRRWSGSRPWSAGPATATSPPPAEPPGVPARNRPRRPPPATTYGRRTVLRGAGTSQSTDSPAIRGRRQAASGRARAQLASRVGRSSASTIR